MIPVPAVVWRGGFVRRAALIGVTVGLALGALAWLDSGTAAAGAIVFVVVGTCSGIVMARRMTAYWPNNTTLSADDRVTVVRATRQGRPIADLRLAPGVLDYRRGLHAAAEAGRLWRWLLALVLVVAVGTAVWDAVFGSWGNAVVSVIYLAALLLEVLWWPKRQARLLANADRAAESVDPASETG